MTARRRSSHPARKPPVKPTRTDPPEPRPVPGPGQTALPMTWHQPTLRSI